MFIKQQGSHYCTPHSLSQCSYIAACTCSLGTSGLIVALLSLRQFILFWLLPSAGVPHVCSPKVAHRYYSALRPPGLFVKAFKLQKICVCQTYAGDYTEMSGTHGPLVALYFYKENSKHGYIRIVIEQYTLLHIYMSFTLNREDSKRTNCVFFLMIDIHCRCGLGTHKCGGICVRVQLKRYYFHK